jgi:hypothetical protein
LRASQSSSAFYHRAPAAQGRYDCIFFSAQGRLRRKGGMIAREDKKKKTTKEILGQGDQNDKKKY